VYVQLEPGIVGMVHISDLSWTKRVKHPADFVRVGNTVDVKIIDIKQKEHRIALSMKETQPDPWPRLANVYPVNSEASGKIKHVMDSGAIVALDFDIDCFVPKGKMGPRKRGKDGKSVAPTFAVGDVVSLKVIEMDVEKHSFICAIMRDSADDTESGGSRTEFNIPKASSSDRNYSLGDVKGMQGLQALFADAEPAAETLVSPPVPEIETVGIPEPVVAAEPVIASPVVAEPTVEAVVEEPAVVAEPVAVIETETAPEIEMAAVEIQTETVTEVVEPDNDPEPDTQVEPDKTEE
jgi:hypothetical protein